jgi:hypothetical protein
MDFSTAKKIFVGILSVASVSFPQPSEAQYYNQPQCVSVTSGPVYNHPTIDSNGNWQPGYVSGETAVNPIPCNVNNRGNSIYNPGYVGPGYGYGGPVYGGCTSFGWANKSSNYWFNLGC